MYVGTIKTFNAEKGWGFVECDQTYDVFGQDIFLLHNQFSGEACGKGDQVCFSIAHGSRGPEAIDVRIASDADRKAIRKIQSERAAQIKVAPMESQSVVEGGQQHEVTAGVMTTQSGDAEAMYYGQVKLWNPRGFGMITCSDTFAIYGKDMFFMKTAVQGGEVQVGSEVSFSVQEGLKGPEGAFVQILSNCDPYVAEDWTQGQSAQIESTPRLEEPTSVDGGATEYFGQVKFWNVLKGYGMITCPDTFAIYRKDMFFMKSAVQGGGIQDGSEVSFSVQEGLKGPEGAFVQVLSGFDPYVAEDWTQAQSVQIESSSRLEPPTSAESDVTEYIGQVKLWNTLKGYGMISCPDTLARYGKDMFFMKSAVSSGAIQAIQVGARVSFGVTAGLKGPEGASVQVLSECATDGGAAPDSVKSTTYSGTIKSFYDEKGWGHIVCDATYQLYGKDMFLMRTRLNGQHVKAGDNVTFHVVMGVKGAEAADVIVLTGEYSANRSDGTAAKLRTSPY